MINLSLSVYCNCLFCHFVAHIIKHMYCAAMSCEMAKHNPQREAYNCRKLSADVGFNYGAPNYDCTSMKSALNLYVKGIPLEMSENAMRNLFGAYGKVKYVKLLPAKIPSFGRGGFVEFSSAHDADLALLNLNGIRLGKHVVRVEHARQKQVKDEDCNDNISLLKKLEKGPLVESDLKNLIKKVDSEFYRNPLDLNDSHKGFTKKMGKYAHPSARNFDQSEECGIKPSTSFKKKSLDSPSHPNSNSTEHESLRRQQMKPGEFPCKVCGKPTKASCSSCGDAYYCGQTCQAKDWRDHKQLCMKKANHNLTKTKIDCDTDKSQNPDKEILQNMSISIADKAKELFTAKDSNGLSGSSKHNFSLHPDLVCGSTKKVVVIDLDINQGLFYCQLDDASIFSHLHQFQIALNNHYMTNSYARHRNAKVGDICASVFSQDKKWYRVQLEEVMDMSARVKYIDYGNSEVVDLSKLFQLQDKFFDAPAFSFACRLAEIDRLCRWSEEAIKFVLCTLQESGMVVNANIMRVDKHVVEVEFSAEGVKFSEELLKRGLTASTSSSSLKLESSECKKISSSNITLNEQLKNVQQTDVNAPKMGTSTGGNADGCLPQKLPNRTRSMDSSLSGGLEVTVSSTSLKSATTDLKVSETECPPDTGKCSSETSDQQTVGSVTTSVSVSEIKEIKPSLDQQQQHPSNCADVTPSKVSTLLSLPSLKVPCDKFQALVCFADTPDNFFIQIMNENLVQLNLLQQKMTSHYEKSRQEWTPNLNSVCAALYEEDGVWYRALVVEVVSESKCKVHFVDFGNTELVDANFIQPLPDQFQCIPAQAVKVFLSGCSPLNGEWSAECKTLLKKLQNNTFRVEVDKKVVSKGDDVPLLVYLDDGASLNEYLRAANLATSQSSVPESDANQAVEVDLPAEAYCDAVNPDLPSLDTVVKINLTAFSNLDVLYCQLVTEQLKDLSQLIVSLTDHCNKTSYADGKWVCNMTCAALFEEDQSWYRANIEEVGENNVSVKYIDFGNLATIPKKFLRKLPACFGKLPALALKCKLADCKACVHQGEDKDLTRLVQRFMSVPLDAKFLSVSSENVCTVKVPSLLNSLIIEKQAEYVM